MKKLLLVDGSNLMMRAAFGGDLEPERAAPIATGLIERAARQVCATHLIIALDTAVPSWRKETFPDYKAQRTVDTTPWLQAGFAAWTRRNWCVEARTGCEADDIIATLAARAAVHCPVVVVSGDSDLLVLLARGAELVRPQNGGKFEPVNTTTVCGKYQIASPALLTDLKALTGESGDNIPGVPGIGPVKAARLLASYGSLEEVLTAGAAEKCANSKLAAQHAATARLAFQLVSLRYDVPIAPVSPRDCEVRL